MNDPIIYQSSECDAGLRLDSCLAGRLSSYSRSQIAKYIRAGAIKVDEQLAKPSMTLCGKELITFLAPAPEGYSLERENIELDIIYSDDAIAVINKRAGMVVHPGAGVRRHTLCNALMYHFPHIALGDKERPGIVHRLDKETSGLMVIAKTLEAQQFLSAEFKARRVKKIYRAWCFGSIENSNFELKTGHMRHPYNRLKFFTGINVPKSHQCGVRFAHTSIEVVRSSEGFSEIKATLHTGRTHQIRAHMADIGHPLLGDQLYGGVRALPHTIDEQQRDAIATLSGQALHASELVFSHPLTKKLLCFTAPLPSHLKLLEESFR